MKWINTIIIFLALSLWMSLYSQTTWTMEKAIDQALSNSLLIQQAKLGIENEEVNLSASRQARYPNLSGNTNMFWNFGRTIDPTTNDFITSTFFSNNYGLNSNVTLFNGFRINKTINQAEYSVLAAREDQEQTKVDIALQVANAYLQVLFAEENIKISERQLQLTKNQLSQIDKLVSAGARAASEKLNIESQIAQSEQVLITSKNNYDVAVLQLKQLMRVDLETDIEVIAAENIEVTTDPDLVDLSEAFNTARQKRPDLKANDFRILGAEEGIDLAKSGFYPSLGVGGNVSTAYSNNPFISTDYFKQLDNNLSYGFGAFLNIPIYSNGATRASVARAKLNLENVKINREQLLETLRSNVMQSIANARASKRRLEASTKALEAQQLVFDNVEKRLEIGAANSFEWEQEKTNLENSEITRLIDKYQYLLDIKVLEFYLGKPLKI